MRASLSLKTFEVTPSVTVKTAKSLIPPRLRSRTPATKFQSNESEILSPRPADGQIRSLILSTPRGAVHGADGSPGASVTISKWPPAAARVIEPPSRAAS
jgi:hypothetical protein